jgi:two-component system, NarL family, nitrate/nitrite response regulator NarL
VPLFDPDPRNFPAAPVGASTSRPTRLLLIVGIRLYREALLWLLRRRVSVHVVGAAADIPTGLEQLRDLRPDVALLDLALPDALWLVRTVSAAGVPTSFIGIGIGETEHEVIQCTEAGLAAFVSEHDSTANLVATIQGVVRGEMPCSPRVAAILRRRVAALGPQPLDSPGVHLTPREFEVLCLIEEGLSNREIASRLCIEISTVKNHLHNAFEKLHVRGRGEAAARMRDVIAGPRSLRRG